MRALCIDDYGLDHVAVRDLDEPVVGPGEVLVGIRACALNRLDIWTLTGSLGIDIVFPHILGADAAGEILEAGPGVKGYTPGTRVLINPGLSCGVCELCRAGEQSECPSFSMMGEHVPGTFAEKVSVPASNVFPFPEHLSFPEAAALGVTFVTAYRMLFTRGHLEPGEWVLITGIGGGLAMSLLQLARPVAGRIYVTSSSDEKIQRALKLGADAGINYKEKDFAKEIRHLTGKRGVDLVVDSASGDALDAGLRSLRKGGRLVTAGATAGGKSTINAQRLFWNQLSLIGSTMGSHNDFSEMLRYVAGSKLTPPVDRIFPFEDGADAVRYLDAGGQFGKVVLEL
ncbi:MAG: zinc-binding dehydrogenase [Actinobacteria bacterium]|nr:zinc-binding dehydrogenase [Actinomycetota bacterium]